MTNDTVVANPQDLRNFALNLRAFNTQIELNTSRLKTQFKRLGETWKDREQQKFAAEFEHTMRVIDNFIEVFKQQEPILYKKAQFLEGYQGKK